MANQEHFDTLQKGRESWNKWRKRHQGIQPDLSGASLEGAKLSDSAGFDTFNFRNTNLTKANLKGATINGTDLRGADLRGANLEFAHLIGSHFGDANLSNTNLLGGNFGYAQLINTNLMGAYLNGTSFERANLSGANFKKARLLFCNFTATNIKNANFDEAVIYETIFVNVDLRLVKHLDTVEHTGPSIISTSTLEASRGDIPEVFLRGAGLSDTLITYVRSLVEHPFEYHSCFICYCNQDESFARQLYTSLQNNGIRCWFDKKDLKIGDFYRHRIDESIKLHDKTLLILSEHSIKSAEVKDEAEKAWKKEEQMDMSTQVLFPLRIDDTVMHTTRSWVTALRHLRHIGDFTGWKNHDTYQEALQELLDDLKAEVKGDY